MPISWRWQDYVPLGKQRYVHRSVRWSWEGLTTHLNPLPFFKRSAPLSLNESGKWGTRLLSFTSQSSISRRVRPGLLQIPNKIDNRLSHFILEAI